MFIEINQVCEQTVVRRAIHWADLNVLRSVSEVEIGLIILMYCSPCSTFARWNSSPGTPPAAFQKWKPFYSNLIILNIIDMNWHDILLEERVKCLKGLCSKRGFASTLWKSLWKTFSFLFNKFLLVFPVARISRPLIAGMTPKVGRAAKSSLFS